MHRTIYNHLCLFNYESSRMDPFSDIIALLRPHAVFSKPITGRGKWGVSYSAYGAPGFAIVLKGRCWLSIEGADPVPQERGDFVLLPASPAFSLLSEPGAACVPGIPSFSSIRHGDPEGEPDFEMLGGSFQLEPVNVSLLLALLPGMIHIRAEDGDTSRLTRIIDLIMDECANDRPGREMMLQRLLEVMLVECLRWPSLIRGALPAGLLAGMQDPALASVLRAMHANVRAGWTVAELAKLAGMSRSAFSARFSETLGCAPMEYLSRWRMTLAQDALSRGGKPLERLAEEIGYESASAFSTAFRRRLGCSPGMFARSRRTAKGH
ncbi:AraC-like DNA-binding protein [Rhizobium petrolearium]|nr:AraC-like DNA-binding protein [Neorhizobium petrolearium]